ncbi:MAG: hypothetical protein GX641_03325 [Mollicutes bacterium]|nr:hypothetical protein [Mollicutes bacterium]
MNNKYLYLDAVTSEEALYMIKYSNTLPIVIIEDNNFKLDKDYSYIYDIKLINNRKIYRFNYLKNVNLILGVVLNKEQVAAEKVEIVNNDLEILVNDQKILLEKEIIKTLKNNKIEF